MIKANELRIGNWVKFITVPVQFTGMACYGEGMWNMRNKKLMPLFNYNGHEYYQADWDSLHPIPLTPEILEKCGLKEPSGTFAWKFSPAGEVINVKCKYLHQLQNLYFALTGEELEYKHETVAHDHG